jgi:rubrerythrin
LNLGGISVYQNYNFPDYYQYGYRQTPMTTEVSQQCLQRVSKAVQDERHDELFYQYLISNAPTQDQKQIISSIRDDERKHNQMFRKIYRDLTGQEIQITSEPQFKKPSSYIDGIKQALFGELHAIEEYRPISECLPVAYKDALFLIITDELKHASKYNYLFTLNR